MHLENIVFHIVICFLHELTKHLLFLLDSEFGIRILAIENEIFQVTIMYYSRRLLRRFDCRTLFERMNRAFGYATNVRTDYYHIR